MAVVIRAPRLTQPDQISNIVFAQHADPVGLGDVASLWRPGEDITGMSMLLTELSVKELEMLREALPNATQIGVLWNPTTPSHPTAISAIRVASERLGIWVVLASAGTVSDIREAFSTMSKDGSRGVLVLGVLAGASDVRFGSRRRIDANNRGRRCVAAESGK